MEWGLVLGSMQIMPNVGSICYELICLKFIRTVHDSVAPRCVRLYLQYYKICFIILCFLLRVIKL